MSRVSRRAPRLRDARQSRDSFMPDETIGHYEITDIGADAQMVLARREMVIGVPEVNL